MKIKSMEQLRKRNYIYCVICGKKVIPDIKGGTDETFNGEWSCECGSQFTLDIGMITGVFLE